VEGVDDRQSESAADLPDSCAEAGEIVRVNYIGTMTRDRLLEHAACARDDGSEVAFDPPPRIVPPVGPVKHYTVDVEPGETRRERL
jgi:hypothetical protein